MEIRRRPTGEAVITRYVEEVWLPYHRELAATADAHSLADRSDEEVVAETVPYHVDLFEPDDVRARVAVEAATAATESDAADAGDPADSADVSTPIDPATADLTDPGLVFAGSITTAVEEGPDVFVGPDRLLIGDVYVAEPYRGSGLADSFFDRAVEDACEHGCGELALDVDVDNERAIAFYEKHGFEDHRRRMTLDVDDA